METVICKTPGCGRTSSRRLGRYAGLCDLCKENEVEGARKAPRLIRAHPLLPQARALADAYANFLEARRALRAAYEDLRAATGAG